ncbi:hypothetical protein K503DRAFT_513257 [Rhizopogon vinicolor AM-OR11-026]|uniref:Uncharacterized protein n=1 Tax=Rhizopogon vinicolor AM-OR11-026 TaxID=1314800 RepID=A0A1B7MLZ0_9AGAM|nr:hypothetical protein K503DRAFT_513257 [Rhizopogon vinicolor AM-OR11-026]
MIALPVRTPLATMYAPVLARYPSVHLRVLWLGGCQWSELVILYYYVSAYMRQISVIFVSSKEKNGNKMRPKLTRNPRAVYTSAALGERSWVSFSGAFPTEAVPFSRTRVSNFQKVRFSLVSKSADESSGGRVA